MAIKRHKKFLALTKFLRDNRIEYVLNGNYVIVNGCVFFPNICFQFDESEYIGVNRIPLDGKTFNFKADNPIKIMQQLVRFKLLLPRNLSKLKFREFEAKKRGRAIDFPASKMAQDTTL